MRPKLVRAGVFLLLAGSCFDPTEIDVRISTNVPFAAIAPPRTARIEIATPDTLDNPRVSLATNAVDDAGSFGDLVVTPGDLGSPVEIRAILGVGIPTEQCTIGNPRCVVASARVGYDLHHETPIALALDSACVGKDCGPLATCIGGACVDNSKICDGGVCVGDGSPADGGPAGSIALVAANASGYAASPRAITLAPGAGDLLVAALSWTVPGVSFDVSDSAGNTWIPAHPQTDYAQTHVQIWYALGVKASPSLTVTANPLTAPDAGGVGSEMFLLEYSGVAALDAVVTGSASTPPLKLTIATTGSRDLVVGLFSGYNSAANNMTSAGAGFTQEESDPSITFLVEDDPPFDAPAGSHDVTANIPPNESTWAGVVAAFSAK